jgi:hypothetical protein
LAFANALNGIGECFEWVTSLHLNVNVMALDGGEWTGEAIGGAVEL